MSDVSSKPAGKWSRFPAKGPNVPWGPTASIVVTFFSYLGSQYLAGFIFLALVASGILGDQVGTTPGQFFFVLLSYAITLLVIWLFLRKRRANIGQLGMGRRPAWWDMGLALLGFVAYFGMFFVVITVVGTLTNINLEQEQELGFDDLFGTKEKIMALISLVVLAPVVEEIVFRGFVFAGLRKKMKFVWATIITSLLFASPHLLASSEGLLWVAGVDTLVLSFVLCYLRESTGSVWSSIALHAIKNGIAFVFLVASTTSV